MEALNVACAPQYINSEGQGLQDALCSPVCEKGLKTSPRGLEVGAQRKYRENWEAQEVGSALPHLQAGPTGPSPLRPSEPQPCTSLGPRAA